MELDFKFNKVKADIALVARLKNLKIERDRSRQQKRIKDAKKDTAETMDRDADYYSDWNIFAFPLKFASKRMLPKNILVEYCKKKKLGVPLVKTAELTRDIWVATAKIEVKSSFNRFHTFELPPITGTVNQENAKQLICV